jgi:chaperone required for assembly of F1-ATPase
VTKFGILKGELDEQHAWDIAHLKEDYDKKLAQNEVKFQRALRDLLLQIQDSIETWESDVKSKNSQEKLAGHVGWFFSSSK